MAQTNTKSGPVVKTSATHQRRDPAARRATIVATTTVLSDEFLSVVVAAGTAMRGGVKMG